jgi:hypothetical protein
VRIGQTVLRLNVVFFGYAQACYVFTKIMQEPAFALREAGIPVSKYMDYGFTAAATRLTCLWQALFTVLLQASLGGFHGPAKCQIEPVLVIKWLGFMLDSTRQTFEVGPSKIEKLKEFLRALLDRPAVSARDLAQVAGRIISMSPAVAPAALYSRAFFQAMKGNMSWDQLFPNPDEVQETLKFWLENMDQFNGRPWWPRPVSLRVSVDASGVGFGGILTSPSRPQVEFQGTFTAQEASGSSTLRGVLGYVGAVKMAAQVRPNELAGSSIVITGDNQGAVSCINNLRSPVAEINEALRELFNISSNLHCDILARWVPRDKLAAADALSREADPSDWGIEPGLYAMICRNIFDIYNIIIFDTIPLVDLFASDSHHTRDEFVSKTYSPGCTEVDAYRLDWALLMKGRVAWVFPPVRGVSQALSLLDRHKMDALIVMPMAESSNERIQLQQLTAIVSGPFTIPKSADSLTPSLRVPDGTLNPAFLGLGVFRIRWS